MSPILAKEKVMVRPVSCGRCHRVCLRRLSQCCPTCATNKDNILKYPKCQNKQQTIMRRLHHDNSTAKQLYMLWRSFWTWFRVSESESLRSFALEALQGRANSHKQSHGSKACRKVPSESLGWYPEPCTLTQQDMMQGRFKTVQTNDCRMCRHYQSLKAAAVLLVVN